MALDTLISSALEEICSRGSTGLNLSSLWAKLTPTPSGSLKASLWTNLLSVPTLQFFLNGNDTPFSPTDPKIQRYEDAEKLNLKIVANEHLRDCFVGLYDNSGSTIGSFQRTTLERLAVARTNGITQNQLGKDLGMEGNRFFYRVKNLECRKLIVRQQVIVKTKEADGDGETKNTSIVNTNMLYLSRYAKNLGVQQRLELNKEEPSLGSDGNNVEESDIDGDGSRREALKDDLLVKDYLPAMRAICDKLEAANDKVLLVKDIKPSLGYMHNPGHKAWRTIYGRLKDAGIVEMFEAKVNGQIRYCLRLLKTLPAKNFDAKTLACGYDTDKEQLVKLGRRFQKTDQLLDLHIDHQIYDAIDAKRSEGATVNEICGRLGLDRKRNDSRFHNLFSRFGMRLQAENVKKTVAFRVWSGENSHPKEANAFTEKSKTEFGGKNNSTSYLDNNDIPGRSNEVVLKRKHSNSEIDFSNSEKISDTGNVLELCCISPGDGQTNHAKVSEFLQEPTSLASGAKPVSMENEIIVVSSETTLSNIPKAGSNQMLPYLPLTSDASLREKRILERLQEEKYILEVEIRKWLESLESDNQKEIDRKTTKRILYKLQQQGQCRIVHVNLPVVTKFTNDRSVMAILHPSIQDFPDELIDRINKRQRSFDKQSRVEASLKVKRKESIPVLNSVTRTDTAVGVNESNAKLEAMRANGFMPAKLVRAKQLHTFLWDYHSSFPGWDDISNGPREHSYKFLELESAMRAFPIQLFLKVVGSNKEGDNMIEKSQRDLRICDFPVEKQKQLMDTQATGRLSKIIDILRRLKLIRMVPSKHATGGGNRPCSPMYVLELRPYIEEPPSVIATSTLGPLDLRPRIRHDFILSNKAALDEYWYTLEYCYSVADQSAALHAFPGSAVPEVFHPIRWTPAKIMSSRQRTELRKLLKKDGFNRKISCKECVKIAKDLNLSVQQVLQTFYKMRKKHFNKVELPSKRKRSSKSRSVKRRRVDCDTVNRQLDEHHHVKPSDIVDHFMEDQECFPSGQQENCIPSSHEDHHSEFEEEINLLHNKKSNSTINQCTSSRPLPMRGKRYNWTDEKDRKLLKQYTRHVAFIGPNGRMEWDGISDLPAPRDKCCRRISNLRRDINFKFALERFCNLLQERYVKHLKKTQCPILNKNGCKSFVRDHTSNIIDSDDIGNGEKNSFKEYQWDDFSDPVIRKAFENLILFKQMAKLQAPEEDYTEEFSNLNTNSYSLESEFASSSAPNEDIHKHDQRRLRNYAYHQKFMKCLSKGTFVSTRVRKSLPASNAVELLKLVFMNTSATPKAQNHLAETLRHYSEHDLFAAFSYLREKKFLIGGDGDQPFVLSPQFLQSVSKSSFPVNTGKRAAKFCDWIQKREKDLVEGEIGLPVDLHCGFIFQLLALVSSGELSISPCVPDEGVGEIEELRSSKRKAEDDSEHCDGDNSKRMRTLGGEIISRKEKGFPGVEVLMHRARFSTFDSAQLLNNEDLRVTEVDHNDRSSEMLFQKNISASSQCDNIPENVVFDCVNPTMEFPGDSPWEAMMGCADLIVKSDSKKVSFPGLETIKTIYMAIKKAGDQGLSLEEISRVVGENQHEHLIDILQGFGYVLKVNTYDSVRIVDALFRSKFFLTASTGSHEEPGRHSVKKLVQSIKDHQSVTQSKSHDSFDNKSPGKATTSDYDVHKVTFLNRPEEVVPETEPHRKTSEDCFHVPILPWINGNGSINKVVYNGLVRRILSIVMQNPGILEESIIHQIDVLNPQSCRSLLELMILDKHLIVRKMYESVSCGPPSLLGSLFDSNFNKSKSVYRRHLFANPMSVSML